MFDESTSRQKGQNFFWQTSQLSRHFKHVKCSQLLHRCYETNSEAIVCEGCFAYLLAIGTPFISSCICFSYFKFCESPWPSHIAISSALEFLTSLSLSWLSISISYFCAMSGYETSFTTSLIATLEWQ